MKIEEAIEALKINGTKEPLTISGSATRMADYFKALSIASEALEREIKQPTVNNWISVKDRLPEDNVRVLVYCEWECEHIALRRHDKWVGELENYEDDEVLAWMPLPNKYISEE